MSFTIADRRAVPEAQSAPGQLAFKTGDPESNGQLIALDDAEGIVTAIVSVTGTEDEVADIIEPGAYKSTLARRRPKVCWAHSWERPIGRVLHIEELLPGDRRLPAQTKDGKPWPTEAGALVATMQFNMRTAQGKDAFEAVRFFSESGECEFSIGYQVPPGKSTKDRAGVRHIKALELYELSPVLFGAHGLTGTIDIKAAASIARERKTRGDHRRRRTAAEVLVEVKAVGGIDNADPDNPDNPDNGVPDFTDGVMVALYPDKDAADAVVSHIAGPDDTLPASDLHVTLAFLGNQDEVELSSDEIVRAVTDAVEGIGALKGQIAGIGMFPDNGNGEVTWAPVDVPGLSYLREQIAGALGDAVSSDHGFAPHMTLGYDIGLIDPVPPTPVTFSSVRVVYGTQQRDVTLTGPDGGHDTQEKAMNRTQAKAVTPGGSDDADLSVHGDAEPDPSTDADGDFDGDTADDGDREFEDFVIALTDDEWDAHVAAVGEEKALLAEIEAYLQGKATTPGGREGDDSPVGTPGGRQNWVDKVGGLPKYIRMVAHAMIRKGKDKSAAIRLAIGIVRNWAEGKGKVTAKVRAAAAAAIAQWEKMKGQSHADGKAAAYNPALDVESKSYSDEPVPAPVGKGGKSHPYLAGSYEERLCEVREAVTDAFRGECVNEDENRYEWNYVDLRATWDDRVILTRMKWGPVDETETYELTYRRTPDGIELGSPEPIELQVVAVPVETDPDDHVDDGDHGMDEEDYDEPLVGDTMPLAEDIARVVFGIKAAHLASIESKAGRVLSGANERKLVNAVSNLLNVLAAAGVDITTDANGTPTDASTAPATQGDMRREQDPNVDDQTTSRTAQLTTKSGEPLVLSQADIDAELKALTEGLDIG